MAEFSLGDKVELTEDYMSFKKGTRGTLVHADADLSDAFTLLAVRTEGTSELAEPNLTAYACRFKKIEETPADEVRVGDIRVWVYKGEPDDNKFEITGVIGNRVEYRYVGDTYVHMRPMTDFTDGNSRIVTEAPAEETKPEREYLGSIHYSSLREGDTIGFVSGEHFSVYRDKEAEAKPAVGTRGTGLVDGNRISGMIDENGDFAYLKFNYDEVMQGYVHVNDALEFEPED